MLLRCESLETPMSQLGQTRSFGDVGWMSGFARKRTRLDDFMSHQATLVGEHEWVKLPGSMTTEIFV